MALIGVLVLLEADGIQGVDALGNDDDEGGPYEDAHAQCGYETHVELGKRE